MKNFHEFRDPLHTFVTLDTHERRVVDTPAFQRLRQIHQLATTYLIYPGATHKRFEHSLGVMHLAGMVYDTVSQTVHPKVGEIFQGPDQIMYWRRVVRLAALCHDIGHLPFSHAAEHELLPAGWDHERLTYELIMGKDMSEILSGLIPPIRPEHVAMVAIGQKKLGRFAELEFTIVENILSEIITGDAFGVDRIDYLLRDAYHCGVAYGRFDHHRLISTLRILPRSEESDEPWLGVEQGGLQAAEAMALARYFMYTQVYFHPVRRAYDIHLKDFLREWLPGNAFKTDIEAHLNITDNEVNAALAKACREDGAPGHLHAQRILKRLHYKKIYERNPQDQNQDPEAIDKLWNALISEFGAAALRRDAYAPKALALEFPVLQSNGEITSSLGLSQTLQKIPPATFDLILCDREVLDSANRFLKENRLKFTTDRGKARAARRKGKAHTVDSGRT